MDPSAAGTCSQANCITDQDNANRSSCTSGSIQDPLRVPVAVKTECDIDADPRPQPSDAEFREQEAKELRSRMDQQRGWRKVIRNFTPS